MAGVRLENLTKNFGPVEVIRGIDLEIADGEFVVFVGPSGCGKSTLLRLIAGLETASAGEVWIGDRKVTRQPPAARGVSMVFQSYALYPHMTVYRNIAFGLVRARMGTRTVKERVGDVSRMLEISELMDRYPRQLSGGQRQRVAIARAIVREPQVFLFDEPLSNLEAALRARTRLEIAHMHDDLSATMVYVTHDQLEAMTLADRIVLLNGGRIEQAGTPDDLYRRPATRFAAEFIGAPAMNLMPVTIDDRTARLPSGERLPLSDVVRAGTATLGIRPEHIGLAEVAAPDALPARVTMVEELGEARIIHATLREGTTLLLRHAIDPTPREGEGIGLRLDPQRLHLFDEQGVRIEPGRSRT
jgi:multiple sugar transport system ATP-binding protein